VKLLWRSYCAILAVTMSANTPSLADTVERDQQMLKGEASNLIANAAAATFGTAPDLVEVRLGDRRLVLPDCKEPFNVSFPFNDRATAQLDCRQPNWRAFVQIRLTAGTAIFVYQGALTAGHTLLRSDVKRTYRSADAIPDKSVKVLEDVLDKPLLADVREGETVRDDHFGVKAESEAAEKDAEPQIGWTATIIIPRGNRLSEKSFQKEILTGRIPTDLIPLEIDFQMLESTRNIMPGEPLRQSAVKLAPAVRKGQELPITIINGALTVTNTVRVMQDAAIGDAIDAVNIESGRRLKVKVVGIGQVELM
jgi:flagella basal body P-ring formation protein FlgA